MSPATLFDELRERGDLLRDRPESDWCVMYAEQMDQWEQMGGVPADLSTVEAFVRIGLTLWRKHKALMGAVDDLIGGDA